MLLECDEAAKPTKALQKLVPWFMLEHSRHHVCSSFTCALCAL